MLVQLSIRNFALIARADIAFPTGFIAITGETGSGKSILLGALNLILGERADYSVIRDPEIKTVVEAVFRLSVSLKSWFDEQDIDWAEETVIRREITAQGKSRAFINDTPVQLVQLKELTEQLIYIHSQHQTLELKNTQFQLDLVDAFSGITAEAADYRTAYKKYKAAAQRLSSLKKTASEQQQEADYLHFQLEELETLNLPDHDFEAYAEELGRLDHLDELRTAFRALSHGLTQENGSLDGLRVIKQLVEKSKIADKSLQELTVRLNATMIELDDISAEAETQLETLEADPERQQMLIQLLDKFNHLLRKHQLNNQAELQELVTSLQERFENSSSIDAEIEQLSLQLAEQSTALKIQATELHTLRTEGSARLEKHLSGLMNELKLPDARLKFDWTINQEADQNGISKIQLLFTANAGMELKPVDKTASGGELSRLMLAVQATLSEKKGLPTLILDEIDTGVSGEVALRIGKLLHDMGTHMQLFAITHLPQVAAKGQHQFEVSKVSGEKETNTSIELLTTEQRLEAIARLMSGDAVSGASLANAQLLMN